VKLEAKTSAMGSGGARSAFYRVTNNEARRQRRQPTSSECGLKDFCFKVEKEREGSRPGTISVGDLKAATQRFGSSSSGCRRAANDAVRRGDVVWTGSRGGSGWRKKKGGGAWVGQLGPKGQVEWASSKERERGPQGGCGPKCKRATETIFPIFSNKDLSIKVKDSNSFKPNLN
jgi:hypothetical protein